MHDASAADADAPDTSVPDTSVRIERSDRRGHASGTPVVVSIGGAAPAVARALIGEGAGRTVVEGTIGSDGAITFEGIPEGPFVLELVAEPDARFPSEPALVTQYPIDRRQARMGEDFWARVGVVEATMLETTGVSLTLGGLSPWTESDMIDLVSRDADFYSSIQVFADLQTSPPDGGATTTSGWRSLLRDASRPFSRHVPLVDAARGDELVIVQRRTTALPDTGPEDPWSGASLTTAVRSATVHGVTMADGTSTAIAASLTPLPSATFELDLRASTFAALRSELGLPEDARAFVSASVVSEPGAGPRYFSAAAPSIWDVSAASIDVPVDRTCFPDGSGACDPTACPSGCNDQLRRIDPGDLELTIDARHPYPDGRDTISATVSWSIPWVHPETAERKPLFATSWVYRPAVSGEPVALVLSPPRNVRIAGASVPIAEGSAVLGDAAPIVAFDVPATGTAGCYRVDVIDQTTVMASDGTRASRRTVATLVTLGTNAAIPEGVLLPGRHYAVRVTAYSNAWNDEVIGQRLGLDLATAATTTGAFHLE